MKQHSLKQRVYFQPLRRPVFYTDCFTVFNILEQQQPFGVRHIRVVAGTDGCLPAGYSHPVFGAGDAGCLLQGEVVFLAQGFEVGWGIT